MAGEENLLSALGAFNVGQPKTVSKAPTEYNVGIKKDSLSQAAVTKKTEISGEPQITETEAMQQLIADNEGTRASQEGLLADMGRMSDRQLAQKYGPNYQRMMVDMGYANRELQRLKSVDRTNLDVAKDLGAGAVSGAGTLVSSIASLGKLESELTGINTPFTWLTEQAGKAGKALSEEAKTWKSDEFGDIQKIAELTNSVRQAETKAQEADDIASGSSPFVAGLARIGRDVVGSGKTLTENPQLVGDLIAENVAGLGAGAVAGNIIGRGAVAAEAAKRGLVGEAAEQFITRQAVTKASAKVQPALGAVQEAGGAADQAGDMVDQLTDQQIKNSPLFKEAGENANVDDVRRQMRLNLTRDTALAAGVTGLIGGQLTKKFDAAPLSPGSASQVGVNMVGEAADEALQGASGGLVQNLSAQANIDADTDIAEGVGQQIAEGAAAGAGLAATMGGPGAMLKSTLDVSAGAANVANQTFQAAKDANSKRIVAQYAADSPTNEAELAPIKAEAEAAVEAILTPTVEPEAEATEAPVNPVAESVRKGFMIPDEEVAEINPRVAAILQDEQGNMPRNRVEVIETLDTKFHEEGRTKEDKQFIASEIISNLEMLASLKNDEAMEYAGGLDAEDPVRQQFASALRYSITATGKDSIREAAQFLMENPIEANPITDDMDDAAALDQVQVASATAQVNPVNIDPKAGQDILDLIGKRNLQVPEEQVRVLRAAVDISRVTRLYSDAVRETSDTITETQRGYNAQEVSEQIVNTGWEGARGEGKLSITQHATEIMSLVQQGKSKAARTQMEDLNNFAQSQLNKLEAIDKSSKTGKRYTYQAYDPKTRTFNESPVPYGLTRDNENSFANYEKIFTDTSLAVAVQNAMATQYPELGIEPRVLPNRSRSVAQREGMFKKSQISDMLQVVPQSKAPKAEAVLTRTKERELVKESGGKKPLTSLIAKRYGGIDPNSEIAKELRSRGITAKANPGLFRKGGLKGLDNIVASEEQHLAQTIGQEGDYLSLNGLLEALTDERNGVAVPVKVEQTYAMQELEARREELDRLSREEGEADAEQSVEESQSEEVATDDAPVATETGTAVTEPSGEPDGSGEAAPATVDDAEVAEPTPVKRDLTVEYAATPKVAEYFKPDTKSNSLLKTAESPLATAQELTKAQDTKIGGEYLPLVPKMVARIQERIGNQRQKLSDPNRADIDKVKNFRSMAFADKDGVIDKRIIEAASIAAIQTVAGLRPEYNLDEQAFLDKQGIDADKIGKDDRDFIRDYKPSHNVVTDITRQTMNLLGLRIRDDVKESDSTASFDALSQELLWNLQEQGIIEIKAQDVTVIKKDREFKTQAEKKNLSGIKLLKDKEVNLIELDNFKRALDPEGDKVFYIGTPPNNISRTQKKTGNELYDMQVKALEFQSQIVYSQNTDYLSAVRNIGKNMMLRLRGHVEITDENRDQYNVNDLKSIEGKNRSLEQEWDDVEAATQQMENLESNEIYFPHEMTKANRMQQVGPANPQSNKHARSALRSTRATLDLTNPLHLEGFWRTVVQMTGIKFDKVKMEYVEADTIINQGPEIIQNKFGDVITEFEKLVSDFDYKVDIRKLDALKGEPPVVYESLLAVARYNLASEAERKSFPHTVPLEADGVTNGPAAVLMKFASGEFTENDIEQFERIGFFFSKEPKSMKDKQAKGDTYTVTADIAAGNVQARRLALSGDEQAVAVREALERFVTAFSPEGVKINSANIDSAVEQVWMLERGAAKGPLTQTTYGAGKNGTASKIASDALDKFYSALSAAMQEKTKDFGKMVGYPGDSKQLFADLKTITGSKVIIKNDGGVQVMGLAKDAGYPIQNQNDPAKLTVTKAGLDALTANMNTVYVDPLYQAVETTMGSSFKNMRVIMEATQIQTAVARQIFRKFINGYEKGEVYSPAELKEWKETFQNIGVLIDTGEQTISIGGAESSFLAYDTTAKGKPAKRNKTITSSVGGEFETGFRGEAPKLAGVSAAAMINIGTGDGLMMAKAMSTYVKGLENTLQIFDGLEMAADTFKEVGAHANWAAYEAWQSPTAQTILETFEQFSRSLTPKIFDGAMAAEAIKEIFPRTKENDLPPAITPVITTKLDQLREITESINARAAARAEFSTYTDQMAAANAPHHNPGKFAGETLTEIKNSLNAAMKNHTNKEKAKREYDAKQMENAELTARLEANTETVVGDVKTISLGRFKTLFPLMSAQSKQFYKDIIRNSIPAGLEIYYGPADQLEAYRQANMPVPEGVTATDLRSVDGQYDPNSNVLFIVQDQKGNGLGETLIHEMTHVALSAKINEFFSNPQAMSVVDREAVQRLAGLANDFLDLNFKNDSPKVNDRINELRLIRDASDATTAKLVNEVIATILTNPDVMKVADKTKINNPLIKIKNAVLKAIRNLFKMSSVPGNTYFSNAYFNAEILTKVMTAPTDGGTKQDVLNKLSPTGAKGAATSQMMRKAVDTALARRNLGSASLVQAERDIVESKSYLSLMGFEAAGFSFNPDEAKTFEQVMELFMVGDARLNGAALVRAQEVFDKVISELEVDDFMQDPALNNPNDRVQAEAKFKEVLGKTTKVSKDLKDRSLVLPAFLALVASNTEFSSILAKKEVPAKQKLLYGNTDEVLSSVTQNVLDNLSNYVVGENKGVNAEEAINNLLGRLANLEAEKQTALENLHQNTYNAVEDFMVDTINSGATALSKRLEATHTKLRGSIAALPVKTAQMAVSLFSKTEGGKSLDQLTTSLNQKEMNDSMRLLFSEIRGRTPDNAKIYDMINKVRTGISAIREEFREQMPKLIQENFSKKLTNGQWTTLHKAMTTDVAGLLVGGMTLPQVARLFSSNTIRSKKIAELSKGLNRDVVTAANNLADYMVNDISSYMLRKNAYAISMLQKGSSEKQISDLVSVLAIEKLGDEERKAMTDLFVNESKGVKYSLAQMAHFRTVEYNKAQGNALVRMNQLQGYIPSEAAPGVQLVLEDNANHKRMAQMGYKRVSAYGGDMADPSGGGLSYYRTNVSSRNAYTQGVAQTVESSQNGVDLRTGRSVNGKTGGVIFGAEAVDVLNNIKSGASLATKGEHLLPIFDAKGEIVAFERAIKPEMLALKKRNTHFGKMLGAMAGRQQEEKQARRFNYELALNVKAQYDNDSLRHDEYENLAASKDKIHRDTWNSIPREMKDNLAAVFGEEDFFPVRRDMIPMVAGYRNAGLSDLWTGVSRISEENRKFVTDLLEGVFGRKTYETAMKATKLWTGIVSEAKVLIVVKSVVVPVMNLASNVLQLLGRGISARSIFTNGIKVFEEIKKYDENQKLGIKLQADIRAEKDPFTKARMEARLESLKAANRRMAIWPLIEAGEYKTISEGLTEADASLREGKFGEWIERKVEELPEGIRTLGKYAVVSKTTALYKGMDKATQYGDFIAKAILYDDMVNRQKKNTAEALSIITEEFVNYDVPAGRSRTFLEEYGLLMFGNYKIRSLKTAVRNLRDNPLRAFMSSMAVGNFSFLGSPVSDNLISVAMDGRLENAIGPGMIFRAPTLNPWYAFTQ